jgi:hypothetical protein
MLSSCLPPLEKPPMSSHLPAVPLGWLGERAPSFLATLSWLAVPLAAAVSGPIDFRHTFLDMRGIQVAASEHTREGRTCLPAMGMAFAAGTTDGAWRALFLSLFFFCSFFKVSCSQVDCFLFPFAPFWGALQIICASWMGLCSSTGIAHGHYNLLAGLRHALQVSHRLTRSLSPPVLPATAFFRACFALFQLFACWYSQQALQPARTQHSQRAFQVACVPPTLPKPFRDLLPLCHFFCRSLGLRLCAERHLRHRLLAPSDLAKSFPLAAGPGAFDFVQSDTNGTAFWRLVRNFITKPTKEQEECHSPKPILLDVGESGVT